VTFDGRFRLSLMSENFDDTLVLLQRWAKDPSLDIIARIVCPARYQRCKPSKPLRLPLSEEIPLSMWQDSEHWDTTSSSTLSYGLPRPLPWLVASHS